MPAITSLQAAGTDLLEVARNAKIASVNIFMIFLVEVNHVLLK